MTRVNGEVRQESHSGRMSVTIPQILSNFSALGYSAGDVVEAEIERIGVLRNPVVSWQEGHGAPPPPRVRPWGDA